MAHNTVTAARDSSPPAGVPPPKLSSFIKSRTADNSLESAFQQLFALWNVPFEKGEMDGCQQASTQGLECVVQRGSWGQLRAFNRPVILAVTDDSGVEHQLTLAELGDDQATLLVDGQRHRFEVADISKYWFGDFLLLWKPQVAGGKQLSPGMHGDEVRWLRQALEHVRGLTPTQAGAEVYDAALIQLVQDFQRQHHLTVDGIAGMQTQMFLDAALATPGTPLLTSTSGPGIESGAGPASRASPAPSAVPASSAATVPAPDAPSAASRGS